MVGLEGVELQLESSRRLDHGTIQEAHGMIERGALELDLGRHGSKVGRRRIAEPAHVDDALAVARVAKEMRQQRQIAAQARDVGREHAIDIFVLETLGQLVGHVGQELGLAALKQGLVVARMQAGTVHPLPLQSSTSSSEVCVRHQGQDGRQQRVRLVPNQSPFGRA